MPVVVRTCFALLLLSCLVPQAGAEVYQWKDAYGNTVFGDRPPRDQAGVQRIDQSALQSPAGNAAEEALFRERERRLLQAMARDAEERSQLRAETAGNAEERRVSQAVRCASVRAEVEGVAEPADGADRKESFGDRVNKAPLRNFLARHCGGDV